jgi:hypothetical protein
MILSVRYWQTKTHLSKKAKNNLRREEKQFSEQFSEKIINSKSNTMVTRTAVDTFLITKGLGVK